MRSKPIPNSILLRTMATATLDTSYLATYTSIPQPNIQSLITKPTPDLVSAFLQAVVVKAQEHDRPVSYTHLTLPTKRIV